VLLNHHLHSQKSPTFLPKESYIHTKKAQYFHQKSPVYPSLIIIISVSRVVFALAKRALYSARRALYIHTQNKPNISTNRALYIPVQWWSSACASITPQRRFRTHQKKPSIPEQKALYSRKNSPVWPPKEPCISLLNHQYESERPAPRRVVFTLTKTAIHFRWESPIFTHKMFLCCHKKNLVFPPKTPWFPGKSRVYPFLIFILRVSNQRRVTSFSRGFLCMGVCARSRMCVCVGVCVWGEEGGVRK